jgi:hypothetical protein
MTIQNFMAKYSLYGSIVTAWNWAESHRLILELDLSNLNQPGYTEDQNDFKSIILIIDYCVLIDNLSEGFDGFSNGDARIIEANAVKKEDVPNTTHGVNLIMMHDKYDETEEKLISVVLYSENIKVIDP